MSYRTICGAAAALLVSSTAIAHTVQYTTTLGPEALTATGSGSATVTVDLDLQTMRVQANFTGLSGVTTASHIHGPTAVAFTGNASVMTQTPTFSGFPNGVTSGTFDQTFDMSLAGSYNPAFVANAPNNGSIPTAFATLLSALDNGKAYLNIHTSTFGGGEIRGYFRLVPEPTSLTAMFALTMVARRRR